VLVQWESLAEEEAAWEDPTIGLMAREKIIIITKKINRIITFCIDLTTRTTFCIDLNRCKAQISV
jgi:hypothetical protein